MGEATLLPLPRDEAVSKVLRYMRVKRALSEVSNRCECSDVMLIEKGEIDGSFLILIC